MIFDSEDYQSAACPIFSDPEKAQWNHIAGKYQFEQQENSECHRAEDFLKMKRFQMQIAD